MIPDWKKITKEERLKIVRSLAGIGDTAAKIAAQFKGASRNAVIGFCHRESIQLPGKSLSAASSKRKKTTPRPVKKASAKPMANVISLKDAKRKKPSAESKVQTEEAVIIPLPIKVKKGPISILEIETGQCRAPLFQECRGLSPSEIMFCGEVTNGTSSYCSHHLEKFSEGKIRVKTIVDGRGEPVRGTREKRRPNHRWLR